MEQGENTRKWKRRAWTTCWCVSLVAPFFTSWFYSCYARHNGGLLVHPEYPFPIYFMCGLLAVVAIWAIFSSAFKLGAKLVLCLVSIGVQILVSFLGMLVEFS